MSPTPCHPDTPCLLSLGSWDLRYIDKQANDNRNSGPAAQMVGKQIYPVELLAILLKDTSALGRKRPYLDGTLISASQDPSVQASHTPSTVSDYDPRSEDEEYADPTPGNRVTQIFAWSLHVGNLGTVRLCIKYNTFLSLLLRPVLLDNTNISLVLICESIRRPALTCIS